MQPVRYAAAGREYKLPDIVRVQRCDPGNWLWKRLWTRDNVALCARATRDKRSKSMAAGPEMKQHLHRHRVRLTLNVDFRPGSLQEGVTVVIQIAELPHHIRRGLVPE